LRIVALAPNAALSGAERVLVRYLGHCVEQGHDVTVAVPPGPCAAALAAAGARTRSMPDLALPGGSRVLALARVATRWLRAARVVRSAARSADVVLVNGFLALPAVRLARVGVPVGWLVHDVVHKREWRALLRWCAPAVDRALAVSDAVAGPLRAAGIDTVVVRNGTPWPVEPVDPAPGDAPSPPVVGVNAALTAWKGQDVLLEAVARLDRDVRVELLGGRFTRDGPYVARLEERAARADLAGRVTMVGHVDDPLARMRTWTVAVSASTDPEAAPLNVLEAMSLGLPMVGTDHGGTPEVLGDAGLLVPPSDPGATAAALARLLDDDDLHRRCAAAGPRQVADGLRLADACAAFVDALLALARPGATAHAGDAR
jgi:glycosyltransferase involved in cell wall biosynthesis